MLPDDLVARLRARAADPETRSDSAEAAQETLRNMAQPGPKPIRISLGSNADGGGLGGLMQMVAGALSSGRGFDPQKLAEQVAENVRTGKASMEDVFGSAQPGVGIEIHTDEDSSDGPRDLLPPASQDDIAAAESALGFPLPDDLKQLYTSVGNGGFGPSVGFLSLAEVAARYQEFRSEPQGPGEDIWPENLLPIIPVDMGEACYDLTTGKIVCWDMEELVDEESEDEAWNRSFKPWADNLADWLETWLAKKPLCEQLAEQREASHLDVVRNAIRHCRNMTPAERSAIGLPDEGWEEQLCRNHGIDPKKVL